MGFLSGFSKVGFVENYGLNVTSLSMCKMIFATNERQNNNVLQVNWSISYFSV